MKEFKKFIHFYLLLQKEGSEKIHQCDMFLKGSELEPSIPDSKTSVAVFTPEGSYVYEKAINSVLFFNKVNLSV